MNVASLVVVALLGLESSTRVHHKKFCEARNRNFHRLVPFKLSASVPDKDIIDLLLVVAKIE